MVVNDKLLDTKIEALTKKELEIREQQKSIVDCRYNLQEIQRIQKVEALPGKEPKMEIPTDRRTKKPYTDAARLKQYNDNIALANKLLT